LSWSFCPSGGSNLKLGKLLQLCGRNKVGNRKGKSFLEKIQCKKKSRIIPTIPEGKSIVQSQGIVK
jgi:hypothetical protein